MKSNINYKLIFLSIIVVNLAPSSAQNIEYAIQIGDKNSYIYNKIDPFNATVLFEDDTMDEVLFNIGTVFELEVCNFTTTIQGSVIVYTRFYYPVGNFVDNLKATPCYSDVNFVFKSSNDENSFKDYITSDLGYNFANITKDYAVIEKTDKTTLNYDEKLKFIINWKTGWLNYYSYRITAENGSIIYELEYKDTSFDINVLNESSPGYEIIYLLIIVSVISIIRLKKRKI